MSKTENRSKTISVYTETDMKDAMKNQYGTIIVRGDIANKMLKQIDSNPKLRIMAGTAAFVGIFFWPLLIVGLAGSVLTANDFRHYRVSFVEHECLTLERK